MLASNGTLGVSSTTDLQHFSPDDVMLYTRPIAATGQDVGMAISNFHIQLDNVENMVKPGEEISGQVVMDVWSTIEIRFVEFLLQGRGTVRIFKTSSSFNEKPTCEIYLEKAIHVISPPEGSRTVTLIPGKYVSKFSFRLPEGLPPTVTQFDMGKGFVFDISYIAKANVAADISSRHISPTTTAHLVKVIKSSKKSFTVLSNQDWQSIPGALDPIAHAEQVTVCCSPMTSDPTSILFKLDRGVFSIGEIIRFQVEILSPKKRNIEGIMCELVQSINYRGSKTREFYKVLIKAYDKNKRSNKHKMIRAKFSMPLPHSLIPSFLPNCRLITVNYFLKVTVKLRGLGGKIFMDIPLTVAPPVRMDRSTDIEEPPVPVFNKPIMQFPYFSKSPLDREREFDSISEGTSGGTLRSRRSADRSSYTSGRSNRSHKKRDKAKKRDPKVTTRYVNGLGVCCTCLGCCGVGIHDA